jgi:hypothetical protein
MSLLPAKVNRVIARSEHRLAYPYDFGVRLRKFEAKLRLHD